MINKLFMLFAFLEGYSQEILRADYLSTNLMLWVVRDIDWLSTLTLSGSGYWLILNIDFEWFGILTGYQHWVVRDIDWFSTLTLSGSGHWEYNNANQSTTGMGLGGEGIVDGVRAQRANSWDQQCHQGNKVISNFTNILFKPYFIPLTGRRALFSIICQLGLYLKVNLIVMRVLNLSDPEPRTPNPTPHFQMSLFHKCQIAQNLIFVIWGS